jgi:hypothetical protein
MKRGEAGKRGGPVLKSQVVLSAFVIFFTELLMFFRTGPESTVKGSGFQPDRSAKRATTA